MACTTDTELQALHDALDKAWAADVPNLAEIRQCRKRIIRYLAQRVFDLMQGNKDKQVDRLALTVISNDAPDPGVPRGICSPVKTAEIRRFEESARAVFGRIESCTTTWRGH